MCYESEGLNEFGERIRSVPKFEVFATKHYRGADDPDKWDRVYSWMDEAVQFGKQARLDGFEVSIVESTNGVRVRRWAVYLGDDGAAHLGNPVDWPTWAGVGGV